MDYANDRIDVPLDSTPKKQRKVTAQADSDTDFQARNETDIDESSDDNAEEASAAELDSTDKRRPSRGIAESQPGKGIRSRSSMYVSADETAARSFKRVIVPSLSPPKDVVSRAIMQTLPIQSVDAAGSEGSLPISHDNTTTQEHETCIACNQHHPVATAH